jgi:hypothetical protein
MGQVLQLLKGKEVADVFIDFESKFDLRAVPLIQH